MTVWEFLAVIIPGILIGAIISFIFFKFKRTKTAGDLHIFPNEDEEAVCYVAWETEPEDFINEDYVLLKVIHRSSQE